MILTHYADRTAWLEARRSGIGGSDVPSILGGSHYRDATPLRVWTSKVLPPEADADSYTLARGRHMESFIAAWLREEAGLASVDREHGFAIAKSGADPRLLYSPDAFATDHHGETFLCEFKSRLRDAKNWEEGVPADVLAQVQHGLDVCNLAAAYVACDTGNELRWARVERDPTWATEVRPSIIAWWNEYVARETPPPATSEDAGTLARIWPRHEAGKTIVMPGEFAAIRDDLDEAEKVAKALGTRIEELKNKVRETLGDAECGVLPDGSKWTWKTQERKAFEVKAMKASVSRVLRFSARKDK